MNTYEEKLSAFAAHLEAEQRAGLIAKGYNPDLHRHNVRVKRGGKYARVDVGDSGKYMVDAQGNIWGIKAYGVIHRGHHYGTLDTIADWDWRDYTAVRRQAKERVA